MRSQDDDILKRELGKLGALGGGLGSLATGALGGALGARLAAGFLPTEVFVAQMEFAVPPAPVLEAAHRILCSKGRIIREVVEDSQYPRVSAVIGSGFLRLNPTVVHFEVTGFDSSRCTATLSGLAKEGLIRQRSAQKAVVRLQAELRRSFV